MTRFLITKFFFGLFRGDWEFLFVEDLIEDFFEDLIEDFRFLCVDLVLVLIFFYELERITM